MTELSISVEQALAEITYYPDPAELKQSFEQSYPKASSEIFLHFNDGTPVTELDLVLGYTQAANAISHRAAELISTTPSTQALKRSRDAKITPVEATQDEMPENDVQIHQKNLNRVDNDIVASILNIAAGNDPEGLEIRAHNFAIMLLEVEERKQILKQKMAEQQEELRAHVEILRHARRLAKDGKSEEFAQVIINILDAKLHYTGHIPKLITVHDVDQNLTPHEDSVLKPGNKIGRLINSLDKIAPANFRLRLPLTDFHHADPNYPHRPLAEALLQQAGKNTYPVFADAKTAANLAQQSGAEFRILTSNMKAYGEGVAQQLPNSESIVVEGLEPDSIIAQEKPIRLTELVLEHLDDVVVFSDDRDRRTCEAVLAGNIEDLILFASRVAGDEETNDYKLAETLKAKDIAFAPNHKDCQNGYQGMVRSLAIYNRWREQRLAEGWPETKTEAQAQILIHEMVASAKNVYHAYIQRLELERADLLEFIRPELIQDLKQVAGNDLLLLTRLLIQKLEADDAVHHKQLSLIKRKLEALVGNNHGLGADVLLKATEIYGEEAASLPENSRQRTVIAARAFRQSQAEFTQLSERESVSPLATPPPDLIRLHQIGNDLVADINVGEISLTTVQTLLEQSLITYAFDKTQARYVLVRFTDNHNHSVIANEYSLIIERPDERKNKLSNIKGESILDGRGILISPALAPDHNAQITLLTKTLHEFIRIALIYYRNPFKPAGGLEKVLREHGKALKKMGYNIRFIGGNTPDPGYGDEFLNQFEHVVINGAHERDQDVLAMANALYRGEIPADYPEKVTRLKDQLQEALKETQFGIIHNPLFPRNPAFTEALMTLYTSGQLNLQALIGWVHDIGIDVERDHYHDMNNGTPWSYVGKRQPGVRYVAVSEPISRQLENVPLADMTDPISGSKPLFITHGSDFDAMQPQNELTEYLRQKINWNKVDQVWITPGRIAQRKGILQAVMAIACLKTGALVITGAPKFTKIGNNIRVDDHYFDLVRATVRQLGIENRVIFLYDRFGEIPDGQYEEFVGQLYKGYDGVLSLPFAEGFGIEVLNAVTENSNLVVSDDPALLSNVGESANYIPVGSHPIIPATTMAAVLANDRAYEIRHKSRTVRTWAEKVKDILPLLGTRYKLEDIHG